MENFVNNQVELSSLPQWEEVEFQRVAKPYKYVIILNYVILVVVLSVIAFIIVRNSEEVTVGSAVFIVGSVLLLLLCSMHLWSYTRWGYALRQKDVLYRSGIFTRRVEIVPYRHIQHVQVKEGMLSRIFALVSIEVFTAGSGKSIQIPGIPREQSAKIQEFISDRISTIHAE